MAAAWGAVAWMVIIDCAISLLFRAGRSILDSPLVWMGLASSPFALDFDIFSSLVLLLLLSVLLTFLSPLFFSPASLLLPSPGLLSSLSLLLPLPVFLLIVTFPLPMFLVVSPPWVLRLLDCCALFFFSSSSSPPLSSSLEPSLSLLSPPVELVSASSFLLLMRCSLYSIPKNSLAFLRLLNLFPPSGLMVMKLLLCSIICQPFGSPCSFALFKATGLAVFCAFMDFSDELDDDLDKDLDFGRLFFFSSSMPPLPPFLATGLAVFCAFMDFSDELDDDDLDKVLDFGRLFFFSSSMLPLPPFFSSSLF